MRVCSPLLVACLTCLGHGRRVRVSSHGLQGTALAERQLKVIGPEFIQTLRGKLFGRDVALVCCGEAHEDAIDLTRKKGILMVKRGWTELQHDTSAPRAESFQQRKPLRTKHGLSLQNAKRWAQKVLEQEYLDDEDGAVLVFKGWAGVSKGLACVYDTDAETIEDVSWPTRSNVYKWMQQDAAAADFNQRRYEGEEVPIAEHDVLIAKRKQERLAEGLEFFDDWLLRQYRRCTNLSSTQTDMQLHVILEAPVVPAEVELHIEPGVEPAPPAHECIKAIELDGRDETYDDDDDPDDGTGSYGSYAQRRLREQMPADRVHHVDPRNLGDADDQAESSQWQALLTKALREDREETELEALGAEDATLPEEEDDDEEEEDDDEESTWEDLSPLPSWEAYFGAAGELLYYSPQIKADYVPLLVTCLHSPARLTKFFDALYFVTVPDAITEFGKLDEEVRSLTRIRSLAYRPGRGKPLLRRPDDYGVVPVKVAPIDIYLKYRGSQPPRTWLSGLAAEVSAAGGADIVSVARAWYRDTVLQVLSDPKAYDSGDFFEAWLRECHPDIYDDVDTSDPKELRCMQYAPSLERPRSKKRRHNLGAIRMPGLEQAFKELQDFKTNKGRPSSNRLRVIAKILVEEFQLRLVDVAAILRIANIVLTAPEGSCLVIVLYAGAEHVKGVASFWRQQGFSHGGLPRKGFVGKEAWEDNEPRGLDLPYFLRDVSELFPVP